MFIKYPQNVNYESFSNDTFLDVKYGLPSEVKFCNRCVESNQRPSTTIEYKHNKNSKKEAVAFDDKGVCAACNFSLKKEKN
jgi:hypothetical protein